MSPCSPNDVSIDIPSGPSGPTIPGFGQPFALKPPKELTELPDGFPEDLLDLLDKLQLLLPSGKMKPGLSPHFGKSVFDAILSLLEKFLPFLMLYKFFLPILKLIICVLEVLCSIGNTKKVIRALIKLFRDCLPPFLNLFPIFALIIMIISLILLLIALIEYIVLQIIKLILAILRNIKALKKAIQLADESSIKIIAKKLGSLLCIFQNYFALLLVFGIIFQTIKEMLGMMFAIPPCDDNSDCCTNDVCPSIARDPFTRTTGTLKYLQEISALPSPAIPGLPETFSFNIREEAWQIYDANQEIQQKFINIVDGYDVTVSPKPIFFPTDTSYTGSTDPKQAAYTVDLKMWYEPSKWGRTGQDGYIVVKDCIVLEAPTRYINTYDNEKTYIESGKLKIAGGAVYDDKDNRLKGYAEDGVTAIDGYATLNNFLHKSKINDIFTTGHYAVDMSNVEYTFKPVQSTLLDKGLITAGCITELAVNKAFISGMFSTDIAVKLDALNNFSFPDTDGAQLCLTAALDLLRNDLTEEGVANFQATATACLDNLKAECVDGLSKLIDIAFDPCKSILSLSQTIQFTSKPIKVIFDLKDKNGVSLTTGLPEQTAEHVKSNLKAYPTFGKIGEISYDGSQYFTADLTSNVEGKGEITASYLNQIFCTNILPQDVNVLPKNVFQVIEYQFIYTPASSIVTAVGDTTDGNVSRRDEGDVSLDSTTNS